MRQFLPHAAGSTLFLCFLVTSAACSVFDAPLPQQDAAVADAAQDGSSTVDNCNIAIKINEVDGATTGSGADREFIEVVNSSTEIRGAGGLHITRGRGSGPDVGKAVQIPDGEMLAPGAFLYLVANVSSAQPGIQTSCIDGAPQRCLQASWDIEAQGDVVYILNRDRTQILCEFEYPAAVFPGEAWGRIPDGSSSLAPTTPSPGEANVPSTR